MDEEKNKKETEKEGDTEATPSKDAGDKSSADKEIKRINSETERLNKAIAEKANAEARAKAGGVTTLDVGPPKPKEETDEEYGERAYRGDANPLKEDGFV